MVEMFAVKSTPLNHFKFYDNTLLFPSLHSTWKLESRANQAFEVSKFPTIVIRGRGGS